MAQRPLARIQLRLAIDSDHCVHILIAGELSYPVFPENRKNATIRFGKIRETSVASENKSTRTRGNRFPQPSVSGVVGGPLVPDHEDVQGFGHEWQGLFQGREPASDV